MVLEKMTTLLRTPYNVSIRCHSIAICSTERQTPSLGNSDEFPVVEYVPLGPKATQVSEGSADLLENLDKHTDNFALFR
jgi:hypothetical protein